MPQERKKERKKDEHRCWHPLLTRRGSEKCEAIAGSPENCNAIAGYSWQDASNKTLSRSSNPRK
jgi:hypothetical protein